MCPVIRRPTRITYTAYTLNDHTWTNESTYKCSRIIPNYITDHFPVFVTCETPVPSYFNGKEIVSKPVFLRTTNKNSLKDLTESTGLISLI